MTTTLKYPVVSEADFSNILCEKYLLGVTLAEAMRNPQCPILA